MTQTASQFDRVAPHDIEAEQLTLSSLAKCDGDTALFARVRETVWPEAFFQPDHQVIFASLCALSDGGKPVTPSAVLTSMRAAGTLEEVGGMAYLAEVLAANPGPATGPHFAAIVAEHAKRREAMRIGNRIVERMGAPGAESHRILRKAIDALLEIDHRGRVADIFTLETILHEFLAAKDDEKAIALKTGVHELDGYRGLFCFGKYTVVAARPSTGKSTFIRWLLRQFAQLDLRVGLIAVEEDRQKIAGNYIADAASIENDQIAYGAWSRSESSAVAAALPSLTKLSWMGTDAAHTLDEISAAVDAMAIRHGCQVIAVDHLHLIEHEAENRERELTQISGTLKRLAKQRGICLIAAAQLSRPPKGTCPPPPAMTDLRGSGGIEEHADALLLLHREDYYRRFEEGYQPNGLCRVIAAKNRNGQVGELDLKAVLKFQRFETAIQNPF
jgi:replicative DNA helicase